MSTVTLSPAHSYVDSEENGNSSEEVNIEHTAKPQIVPSDTPEKARLRLWLNKFLRIEMSDGRVLTGAFLCTDRDANIILGSCSEYPTSTSDGPRILGLVMVPGRHIVSISLDETDTNNIM